MRMFCWLRQWRISSALDDGRDLPAGLRRHVEICDHCKSFLEGSRRLGVVLRSEASTLDEPIVPVASKPTWQRWAPVAAAAAIIVVATVLWTLLGSAPSQPPAPIITEQPNPLKALDTPFQMSRDWANKALAEIPKASVESMHRELNGFTRDAEATARVLVSYLPRIQ